MKERENKQSMNTVWVPYLFENRLLQCEVFRRFGSLFESLGLERSSTLSRTFHTMLLKESVIRLVTHVDEIIHTIFRQASWWLFSGATSNRLSHQHPFHLLTPSS